MSGQDIPIESEQNLENVEQVTQEPEAQVEQTETTETPVTDETAETENPEYQPNYKFKVLGEEKEFDDFVRNAIADEESEKKLRELYEKAYGLDHYKEKFSRKEATYNELNDKYSELSGVISQLSHLKESNPAEFFKQVGIDPVRYVTELLKLEEMTPDQRQVYETNQKLKTETHTTKNEAQYYQQMYEQQLASSLEREITFEMGRPEYKDIVDKVPDFKDQIIEYGRIYHRQHGKDPMVADAVKAVGNRYMGFLNPAQTPGQPKVIQNVQQPTQAQPKPILPNVKANSGSVKKSVNSIAELENIYAKKFGRG